MNIVVVEEPELEPVTAGEAFYHLRLTTDITADVRTDPNYKEVMRQVKAAREQVEQYTRRAIMAQTLRLIRGSRSVGNSWGGWAGWCGWLGAYAPAFELPRPPFISLSSVSYYDTNNAVQTVAAENYYVSDDLVPRLYFNEGFDFPMTYRRDDAVRVEYVAGYPESDDSADLVPASIKQAVLIGTQMTYDAMKPDEREALQNAWNSLLSSFRIHTF